MVLSLGEICLLFRCYPFGENEEMATDDPVKPAYARTTSASLVEEQRKKLEVRHFQRQLGYPFILYLDVEGGVSAAEIAARRETPSTFSRIKSSSSVVDAVRTDANVLCPRRRKVRRSH